MPMQHTVQPELEPPESYLTPEQRVEAIADILSTLALRAIKQRHDTQTHQPLA